MQQKTIQTHEFKPENSVAFPFKLEILEYRNEYNTRELHRHSYYEIFLFEKGGGTHTLDFIDLPIKNNSVHFVTPGQVHRVDRKPDSTGCVMMFTDDFFYFNTLDKNLLFDLPFFHNKTSDPTFVPCDTEFKELKKLSEEIQSVYHSAQAFRLNILQSYLHIFLTRCRQAFKENHTLPKANDAASTKLMYEFKKILEVNFTDSHLVNDYAKKLNVTPTHLNSVSKNVSGKNASEIIKERILLEAKRLLIFSGMNAKQVAYELNFEDQSHFSRFFKNHMGLSPLQFVKSHRGQ